MSGSLNPMAAAMATIPAVAPPPGQVSNFVNPESQQPAMIAVCTVVIVLTTVFVTVRLYSTARITRSMGGEDCT